MIWTSPSAWHDLAESEHRLCSAFNLSLSPTMGIWGHHSAGKGSDCFSVLPTPTLPDLLNISPSKPYSPGKVSFDLKQKGQVLLNRLERLRFKLGISSCDLFSPQCRYFTRMDTVTWVEKMAAVCVSLGRKNHCMSGAWRFSPWTEIFPRIFPYKHNMRRQYHSSWSPALPLGEDLSSGDLTVGPIVYLTCRF